MDNNTMQHPSPHRTEKVVANNTHIEPPDTAPLSRTSLTNLSHQQHVSKDQVETRPGDTNIQQQAQLVNPMGRRGDGNTPARARPSDHEKQPPTLYSPQDDTTAATKDTTQTTISAHLGDKNAQVIVGNMYLRGYGVPQNCHTALEWFHKAADQGLPSAYNKIGDLYRLGQGVPQDFKKAIGCYRKAADQGDAVGQYNVAQLYDLGLGVPADYWEAFSLYFQAADKGYAPAQCCIGDFYAHGRGFEKDLDQAKEWYQRAADQGDIDARNRLEKLQQQNHDVQSTAESPGLLARLFNW
ncbi:hypothetical protein BGX23_011526 [Mortierella sp. AD031]|nr:hypothetical protein BGX23_011526 [Mortierella sp. AD031]